MFLQLSTIWSQLVNFTLTPRNLESRSKIVRNYIKIISIGILTTTILTGCEKGTSNCTDSHVKDTVVNKILNKAKKVDSTNKLFSGGLLSDFKISQITTTNYDEKLDRYTCEAVFSFASKNKVYNERIKYVNSYLKEDGKTQVTVYDANVEERIKALLNRVQFFGDKGV